MKRSERDVSRRNLRLFPLRITSCCTLIVAIFLIAPPAMAQRAATRGGVTPQNVRDAMDKAVRYLKAAQRQDGSWQDYAEFKGGVTSLVTLALLEAGVPKDDPAIQKALTSLRSTRADKTYALALQTMVFCAVDPQKDLQLIKSNAALLESYQIESGERAGLWSYGSPREGGGGGDNSNSQFALLALDEAAEHGATIKEQTWRRAFLRWDSMQNGSGSWGYLPNAPGTGSMTCAGITSMIITTKRLENGDAEINGDNVNCCVPLKQDSSVDRGFDWLTRNMTLRTNPSEGGGGGNSLLYYLYGIERVGRLSGRRFMGTHDWYREGAELLVAWQDSLDGTWKGTGVVEQSNPLVSTSFALLFLAKGRRPVLVSKLRYTANQDWNPHRHDLNNLNRHVESLWQQKMTWQVVDVSAVKSAEDLLQTPVIWISGKDGFQITPKQEELLRQYIEGGGFIFAEAGCGGQKFDTDFRAMLKRILPDSSFRLLPPDHPVWFAEQAVNPDFTVPLWGLDACCRTSVVYTPEDLSCYWELYGSRSFLDDDKISIKVRNQVKAANAMGANVLAYATGRQLKDKLERVELTTDGGVEDELGRNVLKVAKIQHLGGSDDAPAALANMVRVAGEQLDLRFDIEKPMVTLQDDTHQFYPIMFMHGRRDFGFNSEQRKNLKEYLERGGFLFADSICASKPFTVAFRRELAAIFPDAKLEAIPIDHPLLSTGYGGFDITTVTLNDPQTRNSNEEGLKSVRRESSPELEGLFINNRLAVVFSPNDLSCAMESGASLQCKGYVKEDAARIATNILLYAMQQ
ncbi:hypothetical protein C5Y96_06870 [Blastopirellula marina]|uniref:DUF4159 domain-containing protein n=1 Tax=Blastopirellula marina TaxID=124 RepID=A0A2S8FXU2_9BACT|nr:hypothetical protein C5Y96_06870 [Blastopirellula marina]RCS53595.1 DUF4159 domain-containing protein [Bremerella cremea]